MSNCVSSLDQKIGVVLLAAGQGKRFGSDKLTARFRGRPLWQWAAEIAEQVGFSERVLVVGPNSPIRNRRSWRLTENSEAEHGMGTSIATGVRALTDCDRVIIMLSDMPLVSKEHLCRLIAAKGVAFTQYCDGTAGCPAIFTRSVFPLLASLANDQGARSLRFEDTELVEPSREEELADVDSVRDLERLSSLN